MQYPIGPRRRDRGGLGTHGAALAALLLIMAAGCSSHQASATATASPAYDPSAAAVSDVPSPAENTTTAAVAGASPPADAPSSAAATGGPPPSGDPLDAALDSDPAHIAVYVTPYYNSEGPAIQVGRFTAGLSSSDQSVFLSTIATMKQQWQQLSFPELYVGAIRLYDLGYRDEAVYWFYTAQYRGRQFGLLLDHDKMGHMGDPGFELNSAADSFFTLVGPWINGYAFKDPDHLIEVVRKVQTEGRQITDLNAIYPNVVFIDRAQWPAQNTELAAGMDGLVQSLQDKASIEEERAKSGTEARFSQVTSKDLPSP